MALLTSGKSPWYSASGDPEREPNRFSHRDIQRHAERRRQTAPLYSMSNITKMELAVDKTTALFFDKISAFALSGQTVEMDRWCHYYAFDVLGEITVRVH